MEKRVELEKRGKNPSEIKELMLDGCKSTQIVGLTDEFCNLESLGLLDVGLTTLKGFPKLPNLKRLEMSQNRISGGLNHLSGSPKLISINLSNNKIATLEALEPLKVLANLKHLELGNCEVTTVDDYREKVFAMLPGLAYLDGLDQNDEEIEDSDEENGTSSKFNGIDSDLEDEEDEEDEEGDEDEEEEGEIGLSYLQKSIDEESEGEDYEPGEANDSDVEIDEEEDEDAAPRGQKRKLDSDD